MKKFFKKDIEKNADTKPENYDADSVSNADSPSHAVSAIAGSVNKNNCWLVDDDSKLTKRCSKCPKTGNSHLNCKGNRIVKNNCPLSGAFAGLTHIKFNLNTRKGHSLFVPIFVQKFSGYDCHLIFKNLVDMATDKGIDIQEDKIAKSIYR